MVKRSGSLRLLSILFQLMIYWKIYWSTSSLVRSFYSESLFVCFSGRSLVHASRSLLKERDFSADTQCGSHIRISHTYAEAVTYCQ